MAFSLRPSSLCSPDRINARRRSSCSEVQGRLQTTGLIFPSPWTVAWRHATKLPIGLQPCEWSLACGSCDLRSLQATLKRPRVPARDDLPHKTSESVSVFAPSISETRRDKGNNGHCHQRRPKPKPPRRVRHRAHFPFVFRAARACASLCSNSARLSSSGRSKKISLTYNPRFSSGSSLSMLQSLNTHLVNASCSVPWSMSSVHFTNSQRSKRVNVI